MLSFIGGFLLFIAIITFVICLPIIILIGKTVFALRRNSAQKQAHSAPRQQSFGRENFSRQRSSGQEHDIIETTCTVISEEAV